MVPKPIPAALVVTSLPDRVADVIRSGILQGTWAPGDQIIESRLAKQLGVGQHVVREALQHLEFEGYVRKIPNRGNFVTRLSREEVASLFDFRAELESLAAKWARERGRPSAIDAAALHAHLEEMEVAAAAGDYARFQNADFSFHIALCAMAANPTLTRAMEMSVRPLFAFALVRMSGETHLDLQAIASEHRDWLRYLGSASPADAADRTRETILSFRQQVLENWND